MDRRFSKTVPILLSSLQKGPGVNKSDVYGVIKLKRTGVQGTTASTTRWKWESIRWRESEEDWRDIGIETFFQRLERFSRRAFANGKSSIERRSQAIRIYRRNDRASVNGKAVKEHWTDEAIEILFGRFRFSLLGCMDGGSPIENHYWQ